MKTFLSLFLTVLFAASARGEFSTWTRNDGKTAELDLFSVSNAGSEKSGSFKMRNGQSVTIKASSFTQADAKRLAAWVHPPLFIRGNTSVFDKLLDGNLLKVNGKELAKFTPSERPSKYYVFYYSASWCGFCQKYTPTLVDFYKKHKNNKFEIVLITCDQTEAAMEKYVVQKKMPWPVLNWEKSNLFKMQFYQGGVLGLPAVFVYDLTGKNLGRYNDLTALEKLVK